MNDEAEVTLDQIDETITGDGDEDEIVVQAVPNEPTKNATTNDAYKYHRSHLLIFF